MFRFTWLMAIGLWMTACGSPDGSASTSEPETLPCRSPIAESCPDGSEAPAGAFCEVASDGATVTPALPAECSACAVDETCDCLFAHAPAGLLCAEPTCRVVRRGPNPLVVVTCAGG